MTQFTKKLPTENNRFSFYVKNCNFDNKLSDVFECGSYVDLSLSEIGVLETNNNKVCIFTLLHNFDFLYPSGKILHKILWEKEKMLATTIFSFLYALRRRDVLCHHPWRAGGRAASPFFVRSISPRLC